MAASHFCQAIALEQQLQALVEGMYAAGARRANRERQAFGEGRSVTTSDPKKGWQKQQEQMQHALAQLHPAEPETNLPDGALDRAAAPAAAPIAPPVPAAMAGVKYSTGLTAQEGADGRRLASLAATNGGGGTGGAATGAAAAGAALSVGVADVLHLLSSEPTTSRSRVVQWWRINHGPMPRHAKQAARLFAAAEEATEVTADDK